MQNDRKAISTLLYYMLLSSLTSIVFIVAGLVLFAISSLRITDPIAIVIISVLLLWKGAIVGFLTWFFHKKSHNQEFAVKFIGLYLGRFYGIFIGGFLGARIAGMFKQAEIIGFIVGALAFYFAGRWIGSTTSVTVSGLLDKVFSITKTEEQEKVVEAKPLKSVFLVVYIVILPLLFVVIAVLLKYYGVPIGYHVEWLPISRVIAIALTIFSIGYPWLMRKHWVKRFESNTSSPEVIISRSGLTLSIIPAIYGIVLFVGMGATIIELCLFAMASSFTALIWSVKNQMLKEQKVG